MLYLVQKPLTIAGQSYQPGDVVVLAPSRAGVLVREGMVAPAPADPPLVEVTR